VRRDVILSRTNRDEVLNFHVAGGLDKGGGVFVAKLEPDSKPYIAGLRRGDQVSDASSQRNSWSCHND